MRCISSVVTGVLFFCGIMEVEAKPLLIQKNELNYAVFLINVPNDEKNYQGAHLLSDMTGGYLEARYSLGLWLLETNPDNIGEQKKGLSLIMSAYYEGHINASYFMAGIYKKDQGIYKLKNAKKAVELLRMLVAGSEKSPADMKIKLANWLIGY